MAPRKPVKKLYDICLEEVLKYIHGYVLKSRKNLLPFRKHFIAILHGGIRDNLIEKAVLSYSSNIFDLLDILELLGDSSTRKLYLKKKNEFLTGLHCGQLYSKIDGCNIIGLHELHVKVQVEHNNASRTHSSALLHNALQRGLASNLRVLTLHNAADNQALKILGQYAQHLTNLDITSSWLVEDCGIGDLLLKCAGEVIPHLSDTENSEPVNIETLAALPLSQMNRTCQTLQEVRIQDTNTTSISVLLLLMFTTNLKSLGGFLYYRNIGDAVLSVQARIGAPSHLKLTELWDTHLPPDKLWDISTYLPDLTSLYTRAAWLPQTPGVLPSLVHLTADFDFMNFESLLFPYLSNYGATIRKLTIIDQVFSLCIASIGKLCPNLEEFTGKVNVYPESSNDTQLKRLVSAKIRLSNATTFTWIMEHSPILEQFEMLLEYDVDSSVPFSDIVINTLVKTNPPSLQTIKHLSIHMLYTAGSDHVVRCGSLSIHAAYALCTGCYNLKVLGELHTWCNVSSVDVMNMSNFIKKNNLDFRISYRDVLFPAI